MSTKRPSLFRQLLAVPLTLLFYLAFASILVFFHLMQVITYYLMGYQAHKKSVDVLNFFMMNTPRLLGSRIVTDGLDHLPTDRSVIIVSNHQSMMDIPPIIWLLRKHHVKFVAKKELTNWIPSISFNLKKGGSLLIDRSKGTETIRQIAEYGKKLKENGYSICIFPEGTRNKQLQPFKPGGLKSLVQSTPGTLIVPFVVHGNYRMFQSGMFPLEIGHTLKYEVLPAIDPASLTIDEITDVIYQQIKRALEKGDSSTSSAA